MRAAQCAACGHPQNRSAVREIDDREADAMFVNAEPLGDGTIRGAWATARSITSNSITNKVDIYYQSDAPAAGSNTATAVLTSPIALLNDRDSVEGTVSQAGARVAAGGVLELRTNMTNSGGQPGFLDLSAVVEIERDPD